MGPGLGRVFTEENAADTGDANFPIGISVAAFGTEGFPVPPGAPLTINPDEASCRETEGLAELAIEESVGSGRSEVLILVGVEGKLGPA